MLLISFDHTGGQSCKEQGLFFCSLRKSVFLLITQWYLVTHVLAPPYSRRIDFFSSLDTPTLQYIKQQEWIISFQYSLGCDMP